MFSATICRSTSGASGLPLACTPRIARRAASSGRSTRMRRSKRPGRSSAGSSTSGRLVAAMTTTRSVRSKPSISDSSWFSVCSRSSLPPPRPAPRARPTASISSMKTIAGALFFASLNRSRTRAAPRPTNISMNSEALIEKNGTPDSPATARASSVLPVPGGPTSSTPRGTLPPRRWKRSGSLRNCTISCRSGLGRLQPRDVLEGHVHRGRLVELAALVLHEAAQQTAGAKHPLGALGHPDPDADDQRPGQQGEEHLHREGLLLTLDQDLDPLVAQQRQQRGIVRGEAGLEGLDGAALERLRLLQGGFDGIALEDDGLDLSLLDPFVELRVGDGGIRRALGSSLPEPHRGQHEAEHQQHPSRRARRLLPVRLAGACNLRWNLCHFVLLPSAFSEGTPGVLRPGAGSVEHPMIGEGLRARADRS